ncbi:hypothetical protein [Deinococcus sp. 12RED42]|uniref:hypothetical protein n=1 Tax=Deinococcus sp. 12RED42 TaxID=2745872 RepID=UPI001E47A77C|nr:hypothetical protein [Deinococcus sp. 12RED42]MCD0164995.1 hypothetical protein [Deinococcus sp. 12RED42]
MTNELPEWFRPLALRYAAVSFNFSPMVQVWTITAWATLNDHPVMTTTGARVSLVETRIETDEHDTLEAALNDFRQRATRSEVYV